jgi:spoIIIJ-associated protein
VRDHVFSGSSIDEALAQAARALGLPREKLRYVVLDPGSAGARGLSGTPARVAVMYDEPGAARPSGPVRAEAADDADDASPGPIPLLTDIMEALEEALDAPLGAEVRQEGDDALLVRIDGPGREWLLAGEGEGLASLDYLLRRVLMARDYPLRLTVWCEGWREKRDEKLRQKALEVARAVREDGQPRQMPSLNSYERRIVHMAVAEVGGLATASQGEGQDRVVTISRTEAAPPGSA